MEHGLVTRLGGFLKQPFTEKMDWAGWAMLVVFVLTVAYLWSRVLRHILPNGE